MENVNQQHLDLIASMIRTAQRRFYDDSPYYILWGCTVFAASMVQYVLIQLAYANHGIVWAIFIPLALLFQFILHNKQKQQEVSKTHIESLMASMWIAFGITLFIILFFAYKLGENTYPIILCLYALSTFVSGAAFKIKTFILGSIVCWILAIVSFFLSFETQLLCLATGVLFAFIIPGIMLRVNEKAQGN